MPFVDRHRLALVLVPGNASRSLAHAFRFEHGDFAPPAEMRRQDADKWRDYRKVLVVRPTVARFQSAVHWGTTCGIPELQQCCSGRDVPGIVRWLQSTPEAEVPPRFAPQSRWLSAKFDEVVALEHIAWWFNTNHFPSLPAINVNRAGRGVWLPEHLKPSLLTLYARDEALFAEVRVWHPDPTRVVKLYGDCVACTRKLRVRL